MSVAFLEKYSARRAGGEAASDLFQAPLPDGEEAPGSGTIIELEYEVPEAQWSALPSAPICPLDWEWYPRRFVDGRDMGRTIAWLEDAEGYPIPLRLSQVGAACLQSERIPDGPFRLKVERREAVPVVAFAADAFPWRDVEAFAAVLSARNYRLLIVQHTPDAEERCDFNALATSAKSRTTRAMFELEQQVLHPIEGVPTVLDGILKEKIESHHQREPIIGVIKTHTRFPLHPLGFRTLARLQPGQRTPVYRRIVREIPYVTWYLRLGNGGGDPQQRVIRVEICQEFFEAVIGRDFTFVDLLSRCLCDCKTHDRSYKRSAISIHPIQRNEEVVRAVFHAPETLENKFYQTMGLHA